MDEILVVCCDRCGEVLAADVKELWTETCADCQELEDLDAMNAEEWE